MADEPARSGHRAAVAEADVKQRNAERGGDEASDGGSRLIAFIRGRQLPTPLRFLRHGITLFLLALVLIYLVIPQLLRASQHFSVLIHLDVGWIIAGVICEALSLLCYAYLTRRLLPGQSPGIFTLYRIGLACSAVGHVIPGGTPASAGLGYRLLTTNGVTGTDAAFAMAAQGVGSAVVLNVMTWLCLIVSIPLAGFQLSGRESPIHGLSIYLLLAIVAVIALALISFLIYGVTRGEVAEAKLIRAVGSKIPRVGADRLERSVRAIGDNLRALAKRPEVIRWGLLWAALNWAFDAASLWCFLASLHQFVDPIELFAAYGIANILAVLPISPGGLGIVEAVATAIIHTFGVPALDALYGVIGWRAVNFWLPIPLGTASYLSLRRVPRGARRTAIAEMTKVDEGARTATAGEAPIAGRP